MLESASKPLIIPAWLKTGCDAFLNSHTGKSHLGRFGARPLRDVLNYVRLVSRFYPPSSIVVKMRLCQGVSPKDALANLKSRLGTKLTFVVDRKSIRRAMAGWDMGTIAIALSTSRINTDNNIQVSYGAWYAMYCCTLLIESLNI